MAAINPNLHICPTAVQNSWETVFVLYGGIPTAWTYILNPKSTTRNEEIRHHLRDVCLWRDKDGLWQAHDFKAVRLPVKPRPSARTTAEGIADRYNHPYECFLMEVQSHFCVGDLPEWVACLGPTIVRAGFQKNWDRLAIHRIRKGLQCTNPQN